MQNWNSRQTAQFVAQKYRSVYLLLHHDLLSTLLLGLGSLGSGLSGSLGSNRLSGGGLSGSLGSSNGLFGLYRFSFSLLGQKSGSGGLTSLGEELLVLGGFGGGLLVTGSLKSESVLLSGLHYGGNESLDLGGLETVGLTVLSRDLPADYILTYIFGLRQTLK